MPYKDPEKARLAKKKSYQKNRDKIRLDRHLEHQKNLEKRRLKLEQQNRAKGCEPRTKGTRAKKEIFVPVGRRFVIYGTEVYFTSHRGFSAADLREVLAALKASVRASIEESHRG